jgi:NAD(P)-dependent dehydrogenase (short-subunit alcohol dehydrogenase family)
LKPADVAQVIDVNLTGVANSVAAVLPGMRERRRGHLVALSSVASFRGLPRMLAYCASKAGLNAFMEGLRVEVQPWGIHVTVICPGWIRTPMTADLHGRVPGMLEPEAAAAHIVRAIEKRWMYYAFPRAFTWKLRAISWLPWSWQDALIRRMSRGLEARPGGTP